MIRESIQGRAWKVGSNVSTDSIAPGRLISLRANPKEYAKHVLEDARPDFAPNVKKDDILVADRNFGCGSSREHAPWALEVNGIYVVIAVNFARIFRQNMYNCGLLALDMSKKDIDDMFRTFADKDTECKIEQKEDGTWKVKLIAGSLSTSYPFKLEGFEKALVENEGWIGYADSKY